MGAGEISQELTSSLETVQERAQWIRAREITKTAIEEYLKTIGKEIPENDSDIREYAAKTLTSDEFVYFKRQFRFGGKQSLNFFVITGISDLFDDLESAVLSEFPRAKEVEGIKNEPYLADTQEFNDRLYLVLGRFVSTKTIDPTTGVPNRRLDPDECVAVINRDSDLVHVRTSDVPLSRDICKTIANSVGIDYNQSDIFAKPAFDQKFIDKLSERIEKYINMSLYINESSNRTAGSVKFTSQKTESGDYMDLREDHHVQQELAEGDGNISRGYVELKEDGFAFDLNRSQSKIWFRSYEREDRINEIEELINDVLEQSGGYPQQKLQGFGNIPE